jgi:hypothetical protein
MYCILVKDSEDEGNLHPILVWIHGGSFLAGSADTGIDMEVLARNLVARNITFISLNYRLGPLGFMSVTHADGSVEGNFGLWDIEACACFGASNFFYNLDAIFNPFFKTILLFLSLSFSIGLYK